MQVVGINIELGDGKTNFFFQVPALLSFYEQDNSAENGVRTLLFWILCVGFSPMQNKRGGNFKKSVSLYPIFILNLVTVTSKLKSLRK